MSVLTAMALPALFAATAIGLGRALGARQGSALGDSLWAGPAIGLAYIAGQATIAMPSFPPVDVTDRIPWLALVAMLMALTEAFWSFAPRQRFLGRALLLILILGLMLGPVISPGDLAWTTIGWLSPAAVTAVLAWFNLWALEGASHGRDAFRGLTLTSGGAVLVLLLSASAVLGLLGLALTVSLAVAGSSARNRCTASGLLVGGTLLTSLILEGYVYASMSPCSALLLAAAPAGVWMTRLQPPRERVGITTTVLGTLGVLAPVGLAIGWAATSSLHE